MNTDSCLTFMILTVIKSEQSNSDIKYMTSCNCNILKRYIKIRCLVNGVKYNKRCCIALIKLDMFLFRYLS